MGLAVIAKGCAYLPRDADSEVPGGGLGGAFQAMPHGADGLGVDRDGVKAKRSMPVPRAGEAVASLKPARMSQIC